MVLSLSVTEIHPWALLLMATRAAFHREEQFSSAGPGMQVGQGETQSLYLMGRMLMETVGFGALCVLEGSISKAALMQPLMLFANVPLPSGGFLPHYPWVMSGIQDHARAGRGCQERGCVGVLLLEV